MRLTKTSVADLAPRDKPYIEFDSTVPGFGCRVLPTGTKSWTFDYRPGGGRRAMMRRVTLGKVAAMTAEQARRAAQTLHAKVRLGADPAAERDEHRAGATVAEIAERYLALEIRPTRKPSTYRAYKKLFDTKILPALGTKQARAVGHNDIVRLHRAIGARAPVVGNRALALVSSLYNWAVKAREIPKETENPARGVTRFREQARERYLSAAEWASLGEALREAETIGIPWDIDERKASKHVPKKNRREIFSPFAVAAIRLLLFTGCRRGEILALTWDSVDLERGMLDLDAKRGRRFVLLNAPALEVLANLPRLGPYVIVGDDPDRPRADLNRPWTAIAKRAGLTGVRVHDLRHSYASVGAGLGLGLPIVGKLLGHTQASTTQRYAHLDADPLKRATDRIGSEIAAALGHSSRGEVVPLKRGRRK